MQTLGGESHIWLREICRVYSDGFDTAAVQRAAFRKARADNRLFNRQALPHLMEDMRERLISSLKALRVSKAIVPHKHEVTEPPN